MVALLDFLCHHFAASSKERKKKRTESHPPFLPNVRAEEECQCYADHLQHLDRRSTDEEMF
jgi:hypothetical protein